MTRTFFRILSVAAALACMLSVPADAQQPAQEKPDAASQRAPRPLTNVRIEVTITDQREGVPPAAKTVSMVVADRDWGRIRTGGGELVLNVDMQPEIVRDGRVRVYLTMEYRPARSESEKTAVLTLTESLSAILDDGKTLVVSQSADPASNRSVKVEIKATVLR